MIVLTRSATGFNSGALRCFWGLWRAARLAVPLLLAALAGIGSAGCSDSGGKADLTIVNGTEPESLDPAIITGQADGRVVQTIFEGLTRYDEETAQPIPGLSDRWTISPDGTIYTFNIRSNAAWSTGEPITAHDFVYSWFRVIEPATAADYAGNLYYIKNAERYNLGQLTNRSEVGIRALDDHTFQAELENPTPFFLDLCAFQTQAAVPRWVIEKHGDDWLKQRPLPSSGAFELVSWKLNDRIRVRKNPKYWDAANTGCEVVDFLAVPVAITSLNLYLTGQADVIWDRVSIPEDLIPELRKRPDFHSFKYLGSAFTRFNATRKPFDDPRVRKAFSMVVKRERITEKILQAGELPSSNLVPPGIPGYTSPEGLPHDPELARKLLAEAGYPGGVGFPRVDYLFNSNRGNEKIAVELQEMWKQELGVTVELRAVEWKVYLQAQSKLDYDISRSAWIGDYLDPNTFLDMFMSENPNNRTGWKSPRYDQLIREANATADRSARAAILAEAERLLIRDDAVISPIYIYVGMNLWDPKRIQGIFNERNLRDEHPTRAIRVLPSPGRGG